MQIVVEFEETCCHSRPVEIGDRPKSPLDLGRPRLIVPMPHCHSSEFKGDMPWKTMGVAAQENHHAVAATPKVCSVSYSYFSISM